MATDNSVTDIEAVNIKPSDIGTPALEVKASAAESKQDTKSDITAKQVDDKPDADVSFDDFLAVKEGISSAQKQAPVKVEEKKVDDKPVIVAKPEDKKVELAIKPADIKVEDKKVDDKEDKRVYDDLPEPLRPIFKKLHNDPFNTFKPIVKELETTKTKLQDTEKQLAEVKKGALPDNYYEHQRGYTLAPEFEAAANTAIRAEQIANHWKNQLERIRKGEATYQDVNVNPRNGELYLSDPMQVTKESEDKVAGYVEWAQQQLMEKQYVVRSVAEKHTTTHREAVGQITEFEKAAFKVFSEGENAKQWEPVIKDTINKTFPAAFRNNPLASGYAKALITIGRLGEQLKQLKEGKQAEVTKTDDGKIISLEDKKKAGPSASDMANAGGAGASTSDDEVTMDDYKRVKEGVAHYRK